MAGINKVILIGNLGKDPEVRYLENGSVVANVSLATTESYKDRNGNKVESTEWHDLEMWDGLAKIAEQYLNKGKTIYVEGKIKSDTWQDDQGMSRKKVRIRVLNMTMLGGQGSPGGAPMGGGSQQQSQAPRPQQQSNDYGSTTVEQAIDDDATDDLPF
jgi:single-strand DNA-binding protein